MRSTVTDGWGILFNAAQYLLEAGDVESAGIIVAHRIKFFEHLMLDYQRSTHRVTL